MNVSYLRDLRRNIACRLGPWGCDRRHPCTAQFSVFITLGGRITKGRLLCPRPQNHITYQSSHGQACLWLINAFSRPETYLTINLNALAKGDSIRCEKHGEG